MAGTITHSFFALDIYAKLKPEIRKSLENYKDHLITFAQGPDFLYFYRFYNPIINKKYRRLGIRVHKTKSRAFFVNMITYIKDNNLQHNYEVMALLYGLISHYNLDSTVHPFVYYKTGVFKKEDPATHKYSGLHKDMETFIDDYILKKRKGLKAKQIKVHRFSFKVNNLADELINTIDYTFQKTFNESSIGKVYCGALKDSKCFYRLFRNDPWGLKNKLYQIIDCFSPPSSLKITSVSYYIYNGKKYHYLNKERKRWNHPTNKNEIYNYSFFDLYTIALNKTLETIDVVNNVLYKNKSIILLKDVFLNLSYLTGKDSELKLKMQYFSF